MKVTLEECKKALADAHGLVTPAAEVLGVLRSTLYMRIQKNPSLRRVFDDARESMLDMAEQKLFDAMRSGDAWAVQFVLKTIGKNRGYCERQELAANISEVVVKRLSGVSFDDL
jgi:hypothetical protein